MEARGLGCTRQFQGVYARKHGTLKTSREPSQDYIAARFIWVRNFISDGAEVAREVG